MLGLGLVGNFAPQVQATSEWVTLWEDDFTNLNNLYIVNSAGISIWGGTYLLINGTSAYTPVGQIRGLHPVPVFNLTMTFTGYAPTGVAIFRFGIRTQIATPGKALDLSTPDPIDTGMFFELWSWGTNLGKLRVYKWYGASDVVYNDYSYTNSSSNTLEIKWDGINYKVAYTIDGSYKGQFDFYHRGNLTGTSINPMLSSGELEFWQSASGDVGNGFKINKITQRVYVQDDNVYGVSGKAVGLGFDAQEINVWNSLVSVLDDHDASATLLIRPQYVGGNDYMTWAEMKSLIEDKNWETGLHTGTDLKVSDYATRLTNSYNWVKNNLTALGLSSSLATPKMFTALAGSHNWTHAQYGWENLNVVVRTAFIPYLRYANNISSGSIFGINNGNKGYYDWAVSQSQQGGKMRAFFTFTHGTGDISAVNFDSFLDNALTAGYRIMPYWELYKAVLNSYNSTFTVTTSTESSLVFSVSSGGYDTYIWANKPSGSGTWYVYDDLNRRAKIYEDLTDKVGFWVEHGRTYTLRSTKLDGSIDSYSPHYADIMSSSLTTNKLTFTISAPSGTTSTTKVYVGDKGEPTSVSGATSWSYDDTSKILSITRLHSSPATIEILFWPSGVPSVIVAFRTNIYITLGFLAMLPLLFGAILLVGVARGGKFESSSILALLVLSVGLTIGIVIVYAILGGLVGL